VIATLGRLAVLQETGALDALLSSCSRFAGQVAVLHRLFDPGSDRAAEVWRDGYALDGMEGMELHHLYRAMAWLGEELPAAEQAHRTPFAPRTTKDQIEEALFARRRDLFSTLHHAHVVPGPIRVSLSPCEKGR